MPEKREKTMKAAPKKERITKGKANDVDKHVGERLRLRRTYIGITQEKLAEHCGITFQQIQKYERGMNRVSCGRLYQFSQIFNVPVGYFFENIPSENKAVEDHSPFDNKDIFTARNLTLLSLINKLPDEQKKSFVGLLRGMLRLEDKDEAA